MRTKCPQCELALPTHCARCKRPFAKDSTTPSVVQIPLELTGVLPSMEEWERMLIDEALRRTKSRCLTARMLGIGKTTVYRKVPVLDA